MCNHKMTGIEVEQKPNMGFIELINQSNYRRYRESIFRESLQNLLNLTKINTWWVSCPCSFSFESESCRKLEKVGELRAPKIFCSWALLSEQGAVSHITGGNFAQSSTTINGWLWDFLWAQATIREFDAVHRIPVERPFLSTGIRCTASNSRWKG